MSNHVSRIGTCGACGGEVWSMQDGTNRCLKCQRQHIQKDIRFEWPVLPMVESPERQRYLRENESLVKRG